MPKNIVKLSSWLIIIIGVIVFESLMIAVLKQNSLTIDAIGYKLIDKYLISDKTIPLFRLITNLGSATVVLGITILSFLIIKDKKIGLSLALNLVLVTLLNSILKNMIQRPRPTGFRLIEEVGYSFPSGHSMVNIAFYGFIICLVYKYVKNKYLKWFVIAGLIILILAIGISRIYLGVHYTSDVCAGFSIGLVYLILYYTLIDNLVLKKDFVN